MTGLFGYKRIKDLTVEGGCHFRLHDADDNRVATCYVEGNAQRLIALLNANSAWRPITDDQPQPLQDVLVSCWHPSETSAAVFMAYRRQTDPSQWVISGSDCDLVVGVYAWATEPLPAPLPIELKQTTHGPRITCCACGVPTDSILSPLCDDCAASGLLVNYRRESA